jgi:hypothetical protein
MVGQASAQLLNSMHMGSAPQAADTALLQLPVSAVSRQFPHAVVAVIPMHQFDPQSVAQGPDEAHAQVPSAFTNVCAPSM